MLRSLWRWIWGAPPEWPRNQNDVEQAIYPYFLEAFELPIEKYEEARAVLDRCVDDVFRRTRSPREKIAMDRAATK